jgi:hypothetical protein
VATASHRDELLLISGEAHRGDHVSHAGALGDQNRATVDRAVPDPPLLVVRRIVWADQRAAERRREVIDRAAIELYPTCERAHEYPPGCSKGLSLPPMDARAHPPVTSPLVNQRPARHQRVAGASALDTDGYRNRRQAAASKRMAGALGRGGCSPSMVRPEIRDT